jgi:hypothetical protein
MWGSTYLGSKNIMHKTLFPEGIFYNAQIINNEGK